MSDYRSKPPRPPSTPTAALDALLAESAGDPIRRAMWLDGLDLRLRPLLPPPLAAHARLANYERGRLVFVVDAPVWRAKLRLLAPVLLDAARSIGLAPSEFVVKTSLPPPAAPQLPPRNTVTMSPAARDALQAALASLKPVDPDPGEGSDPSNSP